jgi:hypothetical protein
MMTWCLFYVLRFSLRAIFAARHSFMPALLQHGAAGLPAGKPGRNNSLTSSGLPESLNTERLPQIAAGR